MPTITLSKEALQAALKKKRTDEELKDRISFLGTDLEGIKGDDIDVEIFPNRPDLLSQQGFNRAMAAFLGERPGLRAYEAKKGKGELIVEEDVKDVRPYTACAIVRKMRFDDRKIKEIIQVQEKLHVTYGRNRKRCAIGIYPLEHITLPITYTAKKPQEIRFRPLEANKEMTGAQILSQHPTGREYGALLEKEEKYPVFIDAAGKVLSMPPIINSEETGRITEKTEEVFIECSGFSWHVVHGALAMIVTAMADMGGTIEEMTLRYPKGLGGTITSPQLEPSTMRLKPSYVKKYLGYDLEPKEIGRLLGGMGIGAKEDKDEVVALIPSYRTDILHPIDLIEDIAISYGMDKVEATIPHVATIAEEDELESFEAKIREILIGHGLLETKNYNITSKENQSSRIGKDEALVQVASAASQEYDTLRRRVLPSMLSTLQRNKHHEYPQRLFEIGDVFWQEKKSETGVGEGKRLAVALCGDGEDYTKARQVLDSLLLALDLEASVEAAQDSLYLTGRSGTITVKGKAIGMIGETNPEVLERFELTMPVAAFELDVAALLGSLSKETRI